MLKEEFIRKLIRKKIILREDQHPGSESTMPTESDGASPYSQPELEKLISDHMGDDFNKIPWNDPVFDTTWIKDDPHHQLIQYIATSPTVNYDDLTQRGFDESDFDRINAISEALLGEYQSRSGEVQTAMEALESDKVNFEKATSEAYEEIHGVAEVIMKTGAKLRNKFSPWVRAMENFEDEGLKTKEEWLGLVLFTLKLIESDLEELKATRFLLALWAAHTDKYLSWMEQYEAELKGYGAGIFTGLVFMGLSGRAAQVGGRLGVVGGPKGVLIGSALGFAIGLGAAWVFEEDTKFIDSSGLTKDEIAAAMLCYDVEGALGTRALKKFSTFIKGEDYSELGSFDSGDYSDWGEVSRGLVKIWSGLAESPSKGFNRTQAREIMERDILENLGAKEINYMLGIVPDDSTIGAFAAASLELNRIRKLPEITISEFESDIAGVAESVFGPDDRKSVKEIEVAIGPASEESFRNALLQVQNNIDEKQKALEAALATYRNNTTVINEIQGLSKPGGAGPLPSWAKKGSAAAQYKGKGGQTRFFPQYYELDLSDENNVTLNSTGQNKYPDGLSRKFKYIGILSIPKHKFMLVLTRTNSGYALSELIYVSNSRVNGRKHVKPEGASGGIVIDARPGSMHPEGGTIYSYPQAKAEVKEALSAQELKEGKVLSEETVRKIVRRLISKKSKLLFEKVSDQKSFNIEVTGGDLEKIKALNHENLTVKDLKDALGAELAYALILQSNKEKQLESEYYIYSYDPGDPFKVISFTGVSGEEPIYINPEFHALDMKSYKNQNKDVKIIFTLEELSGDMGRRLGNFNIEESPERKYALIGVSNYDNLFKSSFDKLNKPTLPNEGLTNEVMSKLQPDNSGKIDLGILAEDFLPIFKSLVENEANSETIDAKKVYISEDDLQKIKNLYDEDQPEDEDLEKTLEALKLAHTSGNLEEPKETNQNDTDDEARNALKQVGVEPGGQDASDVGDSKESSNTAQDAATQETERLDPIKINRTFGSGKHKLDDAAKSEISEKIQPFIDFALNKKYATVAFTITVLAGTSKVPVTGGNAALAEKRAKSAKEYVEQVIKDKKVKGVDVKLGVNKVEAGPDWEENSAQGANWEEFTKHQFVEMDLSVSGTLAKARDTGDEKEPEKISKDVKQKQGSEEEKEETIVTTKEEEDSKFDSDPSTVIKSEWPIYNRYGGARGNFQPSYILDPQNSATREYFENTPEGQKVIHRMVSGILKAIYDSFYTPITDRDYDISIDSKAGFFKGGLDGISVRHRIPVLMTKIGVTGAIQDAVKNKLNTIPKNTRKKIDFKLSVSLPRGQYQINPNNYINESDIRAFKKLLRELIK